MSESPKIVAARIEVERTRAALLETTRELQVRLQPKSLAGEAWEKAKNAGADLAEDAVDAVAKRPLAVGGAIAALAMFLARKPLKDATIKFYDVMTPLFEPRQKRPALKTKAASGAAPAKPAKPPRPRAKQTRRAPRRAAQMKTEN